VPYGKKHFFYPEKNNKREEENDIERIDKK
jgi:hypothetical protein